MAEHDSRSGMQPGKAADADQVARSGAKEMMREGAKVVREDKTSQGDSPKGNPK